ncbi:MULTISPECIES: hypothetical protein [Nostocales]|uniref:Uncharacterized protein n=3 Tax=Nostocales TaxID=1161 RepID=A0A0C1R656_9CYAN|nr:hypothetical protein [Tolypothrix bouteillei]KAF3884046.1 hypothetical protein DA73_0400022685 [Tolypothrix bouteillei VB521301]
MPLISELVRKAITSGYLSIATVNRLQKLLETGYESEDVDALMRLHQAVVTGRVTDKPTIVNSSQTLKNHRGIVKMKLIYQQTSVAVSLGTIVFALSNNT